MERSLKTAANTKVVPLLFRISGKFVTSTFIPMEMLTDRKMALMTGPSNVSMEPENVKETSLKLALLNSTPMIMKTKLFPSLSALKVIQQILSLKERSVQLNTDLTGTRLMLAQLQSKEDNMKLKWEISQTNYNQLINMFLGLL